MLLRTLAPSGMLCRSYYTFTTLVVVVSCRILYSIVSYLYVSCNGSITSDGEERANLSGIVNLKLCGFCSERVPLPLGAWDGLCYFIVALPGPSISLFCRF